MTAMVNAPLMARWVAVARHPVARQWRFPPRHFLMCSIFDAVFGGLQLGLANGGGRPVARGCTRPMTYRYTCGSNWEEVLCWPD